jgi:hypothetical protein
MKLTTLINALQTLLKMYGDIEVSIWNFKDKTHLNLFRVLENMNANEVMVELWGK